MSSIKNISASNPVPNDLAKRLGNDGIGVILATLWLGYKDLYATGMVRADTDEDIISSRGGIWQVEERCHVGMVLCRE